MKPQKIVPSSGSKWRTAVILLGALLTVWNCAQAQTSFTTKTNNGCPAGLKQINEFLLCATNDFGQAAYQAKLRDKCTHPYVAIPGLTFCVIDRSGVHLTQEGEYYWLTKSGSPDGTCDDNYYRAFDSQACFDQTLALTEVQRELHLATMPELICKVSNVNAPASCGTGCSPGFLRPLGLRTCVEFGLAKRGHADLINPNVDCQGSPYWGTHNNNGLGLCMPTIYLTPIVGGSGDGKIVMQESDIICKPGEIPQVISVGTTSAQSSGPGATDSFQAIPVVLCSPPGIIKN